MKYKTGELVAYKSETYVVIRGLKPLKGPAYYRLVEFCKPRSGQVTARESDIKGTYEI